MILWHRRLSLVPSVLYLPYFLPWIGYESPIVVHLTPLQCLHISASFLHTTYSSHLHFYKRLARLFPSVSCVSFVSPRTAWGWPAKGCTRSGRLQPNPHPNHVQRHNSIPLHRPTPIPRGRYIITSLILALPPLCTQLVIMPPPPMTRKKRAATGLMIFIYPLFALGNLPTLIASNHPHFTPFSSLVFLFWGSVL
jgi:hypothetical protein